MVVTEQLQELAVAEGSFPVILRAGLHCTAAGVLHIISLLSDRSGLADYVNKVLDARRNHSPLFLPDTLFKQLANEAKEGEWSGDAPDECLFQLRENGFVEISADVRRHSSKF